MTGKQSREYKKHLKHTKNPDAVFLMWDINNLPKQKIALCIRPSEGDVHVIDNFTNGVTAILRNGFLLLTDESEPDEPRYLIDTEDYHFHDIDSESISIIQSNGDMVCLVVAG